MKNRWWAVPLVMLISAWPYSVIWELLTSRVHPHSIISQALLPLLWFAAAGIVLRCLCTPREIGIGAAVVLGYSLIYLALTFAVPQASTMFFGFLWEYLYAPFSSLPLDKTLGHLLPLRGPVGAMLPTLILSVLPLLWIPFGRKRGRSSQPNRKRN